MGCSPPCSSVHGIFPVRILECVTISFSGDPPNPGIKPVSPALACKFFSTEPPGKSIILYKHIQNTDEPSISILVILKIINQFFKRVLALANF